jgi:hypothetical protein
VSSIEKNEAIMQQYRESFGRFSSDKKGFVTVVTRHDMGKKYCISIFGTDKRRY